MVILWAALIAAAPFARAQGAQDGEALMAAGNELLEAGKFSAAAQQFSRAMRSDTLSNEQIARALYLRGVAFKNGGKPAQAIADLDSALWLRGLSNKDLARAYLARGEAYQQVGMTDRAGADLRRAKEVDPKAAPLVARAAPEPDTAPSEAVATRVETATRQSASSSRQDNGLLRAQLPGFPNLEDDRPFRQPPPESEKPQQIANFQTEVKPETRPEPKPRSAPGFRTSIAPDEKRAAPPPPRPAPVAQAQPAAPSQWSTSVSGEKQEEETGGVRRSVSNFFGGLWGGDDKDESNQPAVAAPAPQTAQGWAQATRVASSGNAPAAAPPPVSSGSGGYRIQLASLRSEEEAQAAWQRISAQHNALLAGHPHYIEKTTVGNLGTFYRIQIGPFADKAQSAQLCKTLQNSGVDCFLVTR